MLEQREEISRRSNSSRNLTTTSGLSAFSRNEDEDELLTDETSASDVRDEISKFEKLKGTLDDRDSDDEE